MSGKQLARKCVRDRSAVERGCGYASRCAALQHQRLAPAWAQSLPIYRLPETAWLGSRLVKMMQKAGRSKTTVWFGNIEQPAGWLRHTDVRLWQDVRLSRRQRVPHSLIFLWLATRCRMGRYCTLSEMMKAHEVIVRLVCLLDRGFASSQNAPRPQNF